MDERQKGIVLVVCLAVLVGLVVMVEARGSERVRHSMVEDIAALGAETAARPAPSWNLKTLSGQELSLEDLRGKVVFLNFWASWCPPCREEMPSMERLARKYEGRDLVMVAISQDEDMNAMQTFLSSVMPDGKLTMRIPLDPPGATGRNYGTEKLPETYIIDRDGQIVARFVNKYDWDREEVDRFIERLLR
mgnify:CR=1 FL=1